MTDEKARVAWVAVACEVADAIRHCESLKPTASKTDLDGEYGEPEVFTEWSVIYPSGREVPVLREHRWPSGSDGVVDLKPCEHYARSAPAPALPHTRVALTATKSFCDECSEGGSEYVWWPCPESKVLVTPTGSSSGGDQS